MYAKFLDIINREAFLDVPVTVNLTYAGIGHNVEEEYTRVNNLFFDNEIGTLIIQRSHINYLSGSYGYYLFGSINRKVHSMFMAMLTTTPVSEQNLTDVTKEKLLTALQKYKTSPTVWWIVLQYNRQSINRSKKILQKDCNERDIPAKYYADINYENKILFARNTRFNHAGIRQFRDNYHAGATTTIVHPHINGFRQVINVDVSAPVADHGVRNTTQLQAPNEILQYSAKVEQYIPCPVQPGKTLFGIELELEGASDASCSYIHKHLKQHAIMKRDGSLENGVEIVSKPDTIENHLNAYKEFFARVKEESTLEATSNCGIHIHVSKEGLSFLALGRIVQFINSNKDNVIKVAGRQSDRFARLDTSQTVTSPWYRVSGDKYVKEPAFSWDKYTGVNLAPRKTLEFRIFKSTTKYDEFLSFLQFTGAVIDYCKLGGDDNKGKIRTMKDFLKWENFTAFVAARASAYKYLVASLKSKEIF